MKRNSKNNINLFFSAFLILAYVICAYFFMQYAATLALTNTTLSAVIVSAVFVVFGLLLFCATRVGEGKTIFRFSPITLILMVLPSLYLVLISIIPQLPLGTLLESNSQVLVTYIAAVALGYGIPYTFISGFETMEETEDEVVEGGIQEDLQDAEATEETEETEEVEDEIVVEGIAPEATEETEATEEVAVDTEE